MDSYGELIQILASTIRLSVPLIFTALGGLYAERSGIFDIGLEGKMLFGAFAAAAVATWTGSPWLGLTAAVLTSVLISILHGYASITQRGNQIISGVAINFIASGLTVQLGNAWFGQGGRTPQLDNSQRFNEITYQDATTFLTGFNLHFESFAAIRRSVADILIYPLALAAKTLADIPLFGELFRGLVLGHNILVYLAFLAVPLTWWALFRTRFGLRLRAVGENPGAVDTAGLSVSWLRYRALLCCGVLGGFAGAYLSIAQSAGFIREMSAGKGYIALAALVFAKWKPFPVLMTCLLFGFLDAFAIRLQGRDLPVIGPVPVQLIQALPYVLTVILLAGFIGKAVPPKAGGVAYVKER